VVKVEQTIVSADGQVVGRPDRVEEADNHACVVDMKTGRRIDAVASEAERRQLLFYAYLWHDRTGAWPDQGVIETAEGVRIEVELLPAEANEVVSAVVAARERLNQQIAEGTPLEQLGEPSDESCPRCPFRVVCPAYWRVAGPSPEPRGTDVRGVVERLEGGAVATLRVREGTIPEDVVRVRGLERQQQALRPGQLVALQNLAHVPLADSGLTTTWRSDFWLWT
jgi:hypothetical protein